MVPEQIAVTLLVVRALERLGVPYLIGGSLAGAVHGVGRSTRDADVLADLQQDHAPALVAALREAFYIDEEMIRDAIRRRASFNVIHLQTMFKVDVFVRRDGPFDHEQLARRERVALAEGVGGAAYVATAEDTVLAKLEWYRQGGEVAEQQWRDVLGVLAAQGSRLDRGYLRRTAESLGISDLLERALETTDFRSL